MTIQKITYEQLFPTGQYQNVKLGMEITLTEGDMIEDAYAKAKSIATESFERLFQQPVYHVDESVRVESKFSETGLFPLILTNTDAKQSATQNMINAINQCTEVKVLETFKLLVKNNSVFQEAYDKRMEELSK